MISLRESALIGLGFLATGCEAILGADFGDFGPLPEVTSPAEAGAGAADVESATDTSTESPPTPSRDARDEPDPSSKVDAQDGPAPPPADVGPISSCVPGLRNLIGPCGNCGLYLQICNERGTWDPHFCEERPGACAPGFTEQRACDANGTLTATCTSTCTWVLSPCMQSTCMPQQSETQPCGFCGTQTRTCQQGDGGAWQWTQFSTCVQEKACAPDTIERATCGNCGTRMRQCDTSCNWGEWSGCQNEGVCTPGMQESIPCLVIVGRQTRTCDDLCRWGPFTGC